MAFSSSIVVISIGIQSISCYACDTRTVAELITGGISLGSALGAFTTHKKRIQANFGEQEDALAQQAQHHCAKVQPLVEAACGTFLELSTYDYDEEAAQRKGFNQEEFVTLAQHGKHLMSELTPEKLQEPTPLCNRMALLNAIDTYVTTYGDTSLRKTYQRPHRYDVLNEIDRLKDDYGMFLASKQTYDRQVMGYSIMCLMATGGTAWLRLRS